MDARGPPALAAALVGLAGIGLWIVAPGAEALCGPDDFECWDPLETVARVYFWCAGAALAALALSWLARGRWWRVAVATLGAGAAPMIFILAAFTSPTTGCTVDPCVPRVPVVLSAGAAWGWAIGSIPLARRLALAQGLGALGGVLVTLAALLSAGWPG